MNRFLLCTDLDRTLIPNGLHPESPGAKERFRQLVSREEVTLAYVTGRHRALIEQAIAEYDLPQPDFAVADVGTTIYQVDSSGWRRLDAWDAQIAQDWLGLMREALSDILKAFPQLRLQEEEKQNRHKLSFYVPLEVDEQTFVAPVPPTHEVENDPGAQRECLAKAWSKATRVADGGIFRGSFSEQGLLKGVSSFLEQANIRANLIWSVDEVAKVGLMDVTPISANKLHAILFLMHQYDFHRGNTVFAGDSGNDLDVLMSPLQSVLVANASAQVKALAANAHEDSLYLAEGGYLGMNGNFQAGILEGVAHYLPDVDAWLREMTTKPRGY